ncbi:MAG: dTDP-4-dehydrorhamnose reductase [Flavobacterium sp.]|nr:MAG: dTDP-4-dehydrorhamnose reductase [Flavobacterium sp.]
MVVAVLGASGQLGQAIKSIASKHNSITFYYADSEEADITDKNSIKAFFEKTKPDFCINAAAYTAVDKAESDAEIAHLINVTGAKNIAEVCKDFETTLLHISTDFVFDGTKNTPYTEEDETNPQSVYGVTKRDGEIEIKQILDKHFIIRTSWLYSQFGNNFMKTMLRLAAERPSLNIVDDQTGSPTNAVDLAEALITIVLSDSKKYGIYHYSNAGKTTWYGFAGEIFRQNNIEVALHPIPTSGYPVPAARPAYSVMDTSKIKSVFGIEIDHWETALTKTV